MSWLFKSQQSDDPDSVSPQSPTGRGGDGVKDDLTTLSDTIGRQLRGVAGFLAPPPSQPSPPSDDESPQGFVGFRKDLEEIRGSFRSGLSLLSTNKAVTEISKFTSILFQSNHDDDDVAGVTGEVVDFVKEVSLRAECWTDFQFALQNDFDMTDAQRRHASTIEHFVPSLRDLRDNLQCVMGEEQFWMIYFVLLLPRLNEHDAEILSTPQIVETRNRLLQKLQNERNAKVKTVESSRIPGAPQEGNQVHEKQEDKISFYEKVATEFTDGTRRVEINDAENAHKWLKETEIDTETSLDGHKRLEHKEDVSFSDLEDDDNDLSDRISGSQKAQEITRVPSPSGSSDWVQLTESLETQGSRQTTRQTTSHEKDSDGESNDWLKVDYD